MRAKAAAFLTGLGMLILGGVEVKASDESCQNALEPFDKVLEFSELPQALFCGELSGKQSSKSRVCTHFGAFPLVTWTGRNAFSTNQKSNADNSGRAKPRSFYRDFGVKQALQNWFKRLKAEQAKVCCRGDQTCLDILQKVALKFCSGKECANPTNATFSLSLEENYLKLWNLTTGESARQSLKSTFEAYSPKVIPKLGEMVPGSILFPDSYYVDDEYRQALVFAHEMGHACMSIQFQLRASRKGAHEYVGAKTANDMADHCAKVRGREYAHFQLLNGSLSDDDASRVRSCLLSRIDQEWNSAIRQKKDFCYGAKVEEAMADAFALLSTKTYLPVGIDTLCRTVSDGTHLRGDKTIDCLVENAPGFRRQHREAFGCPSNG